MSGKEKKSNSRRRDQDLVLNCNVFSKKIIWFQSLRALFVTCKILFVLAIIGACTHFIHQSIINHRLGQQYQIRCVRLNPNCAFTEEDIVRITNLSLGKSIFAVDLVSTQKLLRERPELTKAEVHRRPPSTLEFSIEARQPYAWIDCPAKNITAKDSQRGIFIDEQGFLFPCTPMQFGPALCLPVIVLPPEDAESLITGKKIETRTIRRALNILKIACTSAPSASQWISQIAPYREWGMIVTTTDGIEATFGINDHQRQMNDLFLSIRHAQILGKTIASINLIPQKNIPVALR